jgi:LysM repeat protein
MNAFSRAALRIAFGALLLPDSIPTFGQTASNEAKPFRYVVRSGDAASRLAKRWAIPQSLIANPDHVLKVGEVITIPLRARVRIQRGDTLSGLSQKYSVPIETLAKFNRVPPPYHVRAGQSIMVPALK